jgi:uncharacterized protein YneR
MKTVEEIKSMIEKATKKAEGCKQGSPNGYAYEEVADVLSWVIGEDDNFFMKDMDLV